MPVHPRACGEHGWYEAADGTTTGSSPRVRGTLQCIHCSFQPAGSSPRVRGTLEVGPPCESVLGSSPRVRGTLDREDTATKAPVHPRACGEHRAVMPAKMLKPGSSPRVRGTRAYPARSYGERFIPARAGNTSSAT